MPKHKAVHRRPSFKEDFGQWNFIIFLTLAFILLVVVLSAMGQTTNALKIKAGLACPDLSKQSLPRPEDCPGGSWNFKRDANGCPAFHCEPTSVTP